MFRRIFIGYLAVLLISFAVLTLAFSLTVRQYLINDTVESLYRVASALSAADRSGMHESGYMRGVYFTLANRIAYADYLVILESGEILESSNIETYPSGTIIENDSFYQLAFIKEPRESMVERDLVAVAFPVIVSGEASQAALILYSRLDLLTQLNQSLLGILALALGAGIIVSLVAGVFVTRVVVDPLQKFKKRVSELARRNFDGKLDISTGDELEELAHAFNEMTDQLVEYDHAQKDFFQKASHELKTPLMSVQGYAEAIRDGIIPPTEAQQGLDIIIKEARRMKALVDQFIYLSKMESIKEDYHFKEILPEDIAREAVHALHSLALDKGISVKVACINCNRFIKGDPEKIYRLFLNIIGNALQYAESEILITIDGGKVTIEDDGPGFGQGAIDNAFKPFYSGDNGGSGLGLAISRAIIEKHRGSIKIGSGATGGALITIIFQD
ncbi:MAG: HAMP domain-containing sensor histidine kinase [Bacillota bacterium]|nr:HAMP domain-containing sensor histidine kinase [Bacillota bacterium]